MKHLTAIALLAGSILVGGCSVGMDGASLSESQLVDNNCSGNGMIVNREWCAGDFGAVMGPYTGN